MLTLILFGPLFASAGKNWGRDGMTSWQTGVTPEGCSIKQVFILDLIKVFVLDLNFLAKINKDFN